MPNYKHLPVGYHGRASSVVVSGTPIRRPKGQILNAQKQLPNYEPCKRLDYLTDKKDQKQGALNIMLEVLLHTPRMKLAGLPPEQTALTNSENLYYTPTQMVAHHANGGCNLQSGDLMGSGTISRQDITSCGALLETTSGGKNVVIFKNGETRTFLLDGDEVIFKGFCTREGFATIGFGEARGVILPAYAEN